MKVGEICTGTPSTETVRCIVPAFYGLFSIRFPGVRCQNFGGPRPDSDVYETSPGPLVKHVM